MKTLTNAKISLRITDEEWNKSVESAKTAIPVRMGDQTPEQWARGILLSREFSRIERENLAAWAAAEKRMIQENLPNPDWFELVMQCVNLFTADGRYTVHADGLHTTDLLDDSRVIVFSWEQVCKIGITILSGFLASEELNMTDGERNAMRLLDRDARNGVMPFGQFCRMQDAVREYNENHAEAQSRIASEMREKLKISES